MPAHGEARLEVGDILEAQEAASRYRIVEIIPEADGGGMWLSTLDGAGFASTERYPQFVRNDGQEARVAIAANKPLPEGWFRVSMHATAHKSYGDNYAHVISIAMRIALGHGLTIEDVNVITTDALAAYTADADVVEDTSPITDEWTGDDGLQGMSEQFSDTIAEAERYGATHDIIVTEFLLALGIRPGIWSDH